MEIEGDDARCASAATATARIGTDIQMLGGIYTHKLRRTDDGWKIYYHRFDMSFDTGPDLVERAREITERMKADGTP